MGKSSKPIVAHHYRVAYHEILAACEIDEFLEYRGADKTAWKGKLTESGAISINAPNLFGGEKDQGGIVGDVDIMFGESTQERSSYLVSIFGDQTAAWRGFPNVVFKGGRYGAVNPYQQKHSYKAMRILKGWDSGACWYPETARPIDFEGPFTALTERFHEGNLDLYSLYDGDSTAGFSITTEGGSTAIRCAGPVPSALGYGVITRPLAQPAPLHRFRCKFKVYEINGDDAGIVELRGPSGSLVFGFNVSREGTYDPLQRPNVSIHGGFGSIENLMGSGPVDLLTPYQFDATYNAETGQFSATITDLTDSSTWASIDIAVPSRDDVAFLGFRVEDVTPGGAGDSVFYELEVVSGQVSGAINPAHVLYESRTCLEMGREPTANINEASLMAAADKLFAEGFGICTKWNSASESVEEFEKRICRLIGGSFTRSLEDGQWYLDLARGDYVLEDLPILTDDDILSFRELPSTLDSAINSTSVRYFDPEKKEVIVTPPTRALGLVAAFGTIHQTFDFQEIPTSALALQVSQRELEATATPTRAFEIDTTRRTYAWRPNQYFRLQAPKRGIADMVCVVGEKQAGTLKSGGIRMKATQDIYTLPATSFVEVEPGVDTRPDQAPTPIMLQRADEAPYIEVVAALPRSELEALPADAGFAMAVAATATQDLDFTMMVAADGGNFAEAGHGEWCATATVIEDTIGPTQTAFTLANGLRLDQVEVGMPVLWDDEICRVDALDREVDPVTISLGRGCADTVPAANHAAGSRLWFYQAGFAYDPTEYTDGETLDVKLLSNTGSQQLLIGDASPLSIVMDQRAFRPYPPGQLLLDGEAYPAELTGDITITWVHRDRVLQADQLVDTTEASVGPEVGTTYEVRGYVDDVLVHSESAVAGTSSTWMAPGDGAGRVELWSVRDGVASWQKHVHEFTAGAGPLWTPANLAVPPKLWLNDDSAVTDAGAGACSQWNDLSGNAYHFTQATSSARPLIVADGIGGRRILRFDGTADYLLNNGTGARTILSGVSAAYAVAVYDKVADAVGALRAIFGLSPTTGGGLLFSLGAGSTVVGLENIPRIQARRLNGDTVATATADVARTDPVIVLGEVDYVNRILRTYVNGALEEEVTGAWASGGTCQSGTAHRDVRVGADTNTTVGSFLNADLGELVVGAGATALTTDEIDRLFGYAAHRWDLASLLPVGHPYKVNPPTL